MSKSHDSNKHPWLYLFATFVVGCFVVRYGFRLISQLRGVGQPSVFAQILSAMMIGFAAIIGYGYWAEYRAELARGATTSRSGTGIGCLIIGIFVIGFVIGLLALAWNMFQPH